MSDDWRNKKTGRSVIIAVDHGLAGVPQGLKNVRERVGAIVSAGPDALIVSPGLAKAIARWAAEVDDDHDTPALFITCDFRTNTSVPGGSSQGEVYRPIAAVEDAVALGAVGVKVVLLFGREDLRTHADNVEFAARCARECEHLGLTMMIEPVFWGARVPKKRQNDASLVREGVRIAFELGADVIKTPYTGDPGSFARIVQGVPVPVLILGGPRRASEEEALAEVSAAISYGAAGVAFGRNVFQSPDPAGFIGRLKEIVHR